MAAQKVGDQRAGAAKRSAFCIGSWMARASKSVPPPGGKGTTSYSGCEETSALAPRPARRDGERGQDQAAARPHRSVDARTAAAPPPVGIVWPVSVSLPSSFLKTCRFFWIMFPDYHSLAVLRERRALRPHADRRLAHLGELATVELVEHHHAVGLVLRRILGPGRAGMFHDRDPLAVGRHHHALQRFVAGIGSPQDLARRIAGEIDDGEDAVTLGIAGTADDRGLAVGRHRRRIGSWCHVDRRHLGDVVAAELEQFDLAVSVARRHAHLSIGRECDMADQRCRRGERHGLDEADLLAVDAQDGDRPCRAIADIGVLAVLCDREAGGTRPSLDGTEDLAVLEIDHGDAIVGHQLGRVVRVELARRCDQRQRFVRRDGDESGGPTTLPGTLSTVPTTFTGTTPRSRMVIEIGRRVDDVLGDAVFLRHLVVVRRDGDLRPDWPGDEFNARQTPVMAVFRMAFLLAGSLDGSLGRRKA